MIASSPWPDLPSELLVSILRSVDFGSIICCTAVCTSWNYAIKHNRCALLSARKDQPPWMFYHDDDQNYKLFDLSTNRLYQHQIEVLATDARCCGSSDGWFITVEFRKQIQLLNPLTGALIRLPCAMIRPVIGPDGKTTYKKSSTNYGFSKVIFCRSPYSSSGYLLVGLRSPDISIVTIKEGDDAWRLVEDVPDVSCDLAFYKGKVYLLTRWMQLYVWDIAGDSSLVFRNKLEPKSINKYSFKMKYLVVCSEELLAVARHSVCVDKSVEVFKFDSNRSEWNQIKSLGDNVALFLSYISHIYIPACDLYGFRGNCIYFSDNSRLIVSDNCSCSMQMYCLGGGFNEYEPFLRSNTWKVPLCFTPSIL